MEIRTGTLSITIGSHGDRREAEEKDVPDPHNGGRLLGMRLLNKGAITSLLTVRSRLSSQRRLSSWSRNAGTDHDEEGRTWYALERDRELSACVGRPAARCGLAMASETRARKDARVEGRNSKSLKMATSFSKLLKIKFSYFAKLLRMATSFGKLLEMLCGWVPVCSLPD